ncbi:MAG: WD40 repeat domain-containing protein [Candidatus Zixiibacteriota bacterium]|nr:MAG: WD40 repeat domain-containing protein [candidate division Zixibacteria bacterium]
MKNRIGFLIGIYLAALLLGITAGCTKEKCVVCPPEQPPAEKEYYFLYSYGFNNWVYTYSTKTGQIIDSVKYPGYPFWDVRFSKDGKYAYYAGGGSIWITDFATGDTVAITEGYGGWLSLSSDGRYLLLSGARVLKLLEIPSLNVVYQKDDGRLWLNGAVHPSKNVAYVPIKGVDSLLMIDFRTSTIRDFAVPLFRSDGTLVRATNAVVSKDGRTVIISGGIRVQLRDAETFQLLREYYPGRNTAYPHPDGVRVFFLQEKDFTIGQPAEVWELNLRTLLMTRVLGGEDFIAYSPYFALTPTDMDFTPDGKYAFIISGVAGQEFGAGTILKLDCSTYKIVDAIYPSLGISNWIRINPREVKGGE